MKNLDFKEENERVYLMGDTGFNYVIGYVFMYINQKQYCFTNTTQKVEVNLEDTFECPGIKHGVFSQLSTTRWSP